MILIKALRRIAMLLRRFSFKKCGVNVVFDPVSSYISYKNVEVGDEVYVGPLAFISSTHSTIKIGNNVMLGPSVHMYGGNHIYNIVGTPMNKVKKDKRRVDSDIVIEDEVWIGGNTTILSGVVIGRGSIIGAGSVVTTDVPPYTISAGNPCGKIKDRFAPDEIVVHELGIYH